jgi:gamma-D-glutamyl-L-lysine dipeptidyl-peptidase
MNYGICNLSVIPVRAEASDRSEMVTQLLLGDIFEVIGEQDNWIFIRTQFDNYEGWIDKKQSFSLSFENYQRIGLQNHPLTADLISVCYDKDLKNVFPIIIGSQLPFFNNKKFELSQEELIYEGTVLHPEKKNFQKFVRENALLYLNAPYLWGGKSPLGIDCSGFTQMVYKLCGVALPRDASQQAILGETLSFVEESIEGDLAFFDNAEGKITHVGIILEDNKIIHASGKVRIDVLDHYGIFNLDIQKYTHSLRIIKRIV